MGGLCSFGANGAEQGKVKTKGGMARRERRLSGCRGTEYEDSGGGRASGIIEVHWVMCVCVS